MKSTTRVTRKDVAKLAGVSTATVSYVINNGPRPVAQETREKVLRAIDQLGYRPNQLARSLTTGRTRTIGIIIPDISDPFFPQFILGAESVARECGYNVFLCNANRDPRSELSYIALLSERRIDGLIIAGSRLGEEDLRTVTREHNAVVLTPWMLPDAVLFCIDGFEGGLQIGEYLISLGHKRIRYLEGTWVWHASSRYQGLVCAMKDAGIATDHIIATSLSAVTVGTGRKATLQLLEQDPSITALVCYNDVLALGALQACAEVGRHVPEDLSVTGFDDISEASRSHPPLTTIRIDRYNLGTAMMRKLIDIIENASMIGERVMIAGHLVKRASCAPPKYR
jgi:LacI family transcriptional regulator